MSQVACSRTSLILVERGRSTLKQLGTGFLPPKASGKDRVDAARPRSVMRWAMGPVKWLLFFAQSVALALQQVNGCYKFTALPGHGSANVVVPVGADT